MINNNKEVNFSVDAQIIGELGERLVSKNYIALSELIKNCYDADSNNVKVIFRNVTSKNLRDSEIVITDDGHGMSAEQVEKYWMRVATSNKLSDKFSNKYGRPKTGSKGIGRFACQRLAKELFLETIGTNSEGKIEKTTIFFPWDKFEPGKNLEDIKLNSESQLSGTETGTTLILRNLRKNWTENEFKILQRHILMLSTAKDIQREGFIYDKGLKIILEASEFETESIELFEKFMNSGWATLKGKIDKDGKAQVSISALEVKNKKYVIPGNFSKIIDAEFEIQWISWDSKHMRDPETLKLGITQEIMREFGGIRIYLNGFRVYPYGTKGDDWLNIDRDNSRSLKKPEHNIFEGVLKDLNLKHSNRFLLYLPRNQNLYGSVEIKGEAVKNLQVQINREGFYEEDTSYKQLTNFVRLSLEWATIQYANFKEILSKKEKKKAEEEFQKSYNEESSNYPKNFQTLGSSNENTPSEMSINPSSDSSSNSTHFIPKNSETKPDEKEKFPKLNTFEVALNYIYKILGEVEENKTTIKSAITVVKTNLETREIQLNQLRNVATLNSVFLAFNHETKSVINELGSLSWKLEDKFLPEIESSKKEEVKEIITSIDEKKERFIKLQELFSILSQSESNKNRYKNSVLKIVERVIDTFKYYLEKYNINISYNFPEYFKTPKMYEAEFYTIFMNLLSNSIKSVIAKGSNNIFIEGERINGIFCFRIYDDGVGIPEEFEKDIFSPLKADPENKIYEALKEKDERLLDLFGRGTGLGLSIVFDILKNNNGEIFINKGFEDKSYNTCFEVNIYDKN